MRTDVEYTLLAGAAYTSTRSARNQILKPQGWATYWPAGLYAKLLDMEFTVRDDTILHKAGGFEARVLRNGGLKRLAAALLLSVLVSGCFNDDSKIKWTEDVLLADGRTVTLTRYQEFKGPREIGQPPTESYYWFEFKHPDTGEIVRWETKREPSTVALFIHNKEVMLVAAPRFGSGMEDFGCPNPPYLFYRYSSNRWERLDLSTIQLKRLRSNMTYSVGDRLAAIKDGNGKLDLGITSNATYQRRPWVVNFENVKQTFEPINCTRTSNMLIAADESK